MQCHHQASALPHQAKVRPAEVTKIPVCLSASDSLIASGVSPRRCCQRNPLAIQYTVQPTAIWSRPPSSKPLLRPVLCQRQAASPTASMTTSTADARASPASVPIHTEKLLLVVGVALIDLQSAGGPRVLLAERPPGKANAGLWEFPGGKVDAGETPEGALVRELQEELGLTVQPGDLVPLSFVSWPYPTFHLFMPLYSCTRWQGAPHGKEGQGVVWVTRDQLATYSLTPADVPLVPAVMRTLQEAAAGGAV